MRNFNKLYHGTAEDVSALLEQGVELNPAETGALFCNIMRKLARLEALAESPAPVHHRYKIAAVAINAEENLHDLDVNVAGVYFYDAIGSEEALDIFHGSVPIKVLDDFEIDVEIDG